MQNATASMSDSSSEDDVLYVPGSASGAGGRAQPAAQPAARAGGRARNVCRTCGMSGHNAATCMRQHVQRRITAEEFAAGGAAGSGSRRPREDDADADADRSVRARRSAEEPRSEDQAAEITRLRTELEEVQRSHEMAQAVHKDIQEAFNKQAEENAAKVREMESELKKLKDTLKATEERATQLKMDTDEQEQQITDLSADFDTVVSERDRLRQQVDDAKEENKRLRDELSFVQTGRKKAQDLLALSVVKDTTDQLHKNMSMQWVDAKDDESWNLILQSAEKSLQNAKARSVMVQMQRKCNDAVAKTAQTSDSVWRDALFSEEAVYPFTTKIVEVPGSGKDKMERGPELKFVHGERKPFMMLTAPCLQHGMAYTCPRRIHLDPRKQSFETSGTPPIFEHISQIRQVHPNGMVLPSSYEVLKEKYDAVEERWKLAIGIDAATAHEDRAFLEALKEFEHPTTQRIICPLVPISEGQGGSASNGAKFYLADWKTQLTQEIQPNHPLFEMQMRSFELMSTVRQQAMGLDKMRIHYGESGRMQWNRQHAQRQDRCNWQTLLKANLAVLKEVQTMLGKQDGDEILVHPPAVRDHDDPVPQPECLVDCGIASICDRKTIEESFAPGSTLKYYEGGVPDEHNHYHTIDDGESRYIGEWRILHEAALLDMDNSDRRRRWSGYERNLHARFVRIRDLYLSTIEECYKASQAGSQKDPMGV